MPGTFSRNVLCLSLACWTLAAQAALPSTTPTAVEVRSQAQLDAVLSFSQPTPLDALTPHGKRRLLRSIRWSEEGGVVGFDSGVAVRELDAAQLAALMAFLGTEAWLPMLARDMDGAPIRLPAPAADIDETFQAFARAADEDAARRDDEAQGTTSTSTAVEALHARYGRLFGAAMREAALRQAAPGDLLALFEAAWLMNFYYPGSALADVLRTHRELAARGVSTRRQLDRRVLNALVTVRRFDEARAFAAARPGLARELIPSVSDPLGPGFKGRSLYRCEQARQTLVREAAPAPAGLQVVMVVDAGCQPSARALAALRDDSELRSRLREAKLLLVTSPSSSIPLDFIAAWNDANPALPMRAPASLEEWEQADPSGVPEFFVLKDGKRVGQLRSGWPHEGNKAALMRLLDSAAAQ